MHLFRRNNIRISNVTRAYRAIVPVRRKSLQNVQLKAEKKQ